MVVRRFFFGGKNIRQVVATVEAIHFFQLDGLWSPEIELFYTFFHNEKAYSGSDFIRIDDLVHDDSLLLSNHQGFLSLSTSEITLVGEEYVESYLMQAMPYIDIEYNSKNPEESRLLNPDNEKRQLLQNFSIDFPWSKRI